MASFDVNKIVPALKGHPNDESKHFIRVITCAYLGLQAALGFLMPGLVLGFYGGGFFPKSAVTDLFVAFAIALGGLAYVYWKSQDWDKRAQDDIVVAFGGLFAALAVWNLITAKWGYELGFFNFLHIVPNAAFAVLHLRQAGLVKF